MKRAVKRILSTVLVAVMLIGIAPMGGIDLAPKAGAKDISSYSVGDIITYGSYPQSKVTDSDLVAKIEAAGEKYVWCDYNYYAGTGVWDDGNMKPVDGMMLYKDIPYNGSKYRAVKINQFRPYWTGYTSSSSDSYQDNNSYYTGNVYYFKYEPLTWRVLDPSEGYVMCNKIIDSQAYQNFIYDNGSQYYNSKGCANYASDWVTSTLRQWLNNSFFNTAFSAEEKKQIGTSHLENKSTYSSTYDSADTYDKIFLISYYDAINSAYDFDSSNRQMKGTDYAKCQGLYVRSSYGGTSWWWLRSSSISRDAAEVGDDGCAYSRDFGWCVSFTSFGVVPAFKFNPKSTIPEGETFEMVNNEVAMKCDFEYTDAFFEQSSYIYNHKLAITSCCFATSAMVGDGAPFNDPESAKTMLKTIGFGNDSGEAVSCYGYQKSPTMNSIACVVSNKNIGDTSIIAVAVRGGGYEGEWAGNFNVGTDTNHAGFNVAKQQVCDNIIRFINQDGVTLNKNVKFWITGYSRAAATANLVAADVNNKTLDCTSTCYDLSDYNYDTDDVFAYCFETPRNTRDKNAKNAKYNNIFNIVNRIDPVPRVAPAAWDYVRYGKDCYLPSKETYNPKAYSNLVEKVSNNFDLIYTGKGDKSYKEDFTFYEIKLKYKLISITHVDVSIVENKSISQGVFWDNFVKYLADGLKSPEYYTANYQNGLTKAVYKLMGNIKYDEILQQRGFWDYLYDQISVKYILDNVLINSNVLKNLLIEALTIYFADAGMTRTEATEIADSLSRVLVEFAFYPNYLLTAIKNGSQLFLPHYTETTLAWLKTLNGDFSEANTALSKMLTGGEKYRVATVNCPVNVMVYDSDGNLCGSIINNEVQYIENGVSVYVNDNGEKCFCLPEDEEFRFEFTGYDDGTLNCSFAEVDAATGEKLTSKNYYDMPLSNGKTYTGILEEKDDDTIKSHVYGNDDEEIPLSEVVDYETAQTYTVTAAAENENGTVSGGGEFRKGEFVQLVATPADGYSFVGWYSGGKLVSNDLVYRFMVSEDSTLTAKFAPIPKNVKSVSINDISLNYKKSTTLNPTITADDGAEYKVEYSTSNAKVATVDKNGKVTATKRGSGTATITCTVTDSNGNVVKDTCKVNVSLTWWQWIIIIVLFGWIWY